MGRPIFIQVSRFIPTLFHLSTLKIARKKKGVSPVEATHWIGRAIRTRKSSPVRVLAWAQAAAQCR